MFAEPKVQVDPYCIAKITSFIPDSKTYSYALNAKNKHISKLLFTNALKKSTYLFYTKDTPEIYSLPSKKQVTNERIPKINFENFNMKRLENYAFFYNNNEKEIHSFQFNPFNYALLKVDESIEETGFYLTGLNSFFVIVNHKSLYKFSNLSLVNIIPLVDGFFFEEVFIGDYLYSDFYGDELIMQNISEKNSYRLKFANPTHYDIIGRDMIVIDFSGEKVLDVLPPSDKKKEDLKNILFRFNKIEDGKISLEFIDYLPAEVKVERFDENNDLFFSRHLEEKYLTFWNKNKLLGKLDLTHDEKIVNISKLDDNRMLVEYTRYIVVIDFLKCAVLNIIDMKQRIPEIRYNCVLEQFGDYYHQTLLVDQEELGAWRNYILDQNFEKVLEIEGDDFHLFSE